MHDIRSSFVAGEGPCKDSPVARKKSRSRDDVVPGSLAAIAIARTQSRTSNHRSEDRQAAPANSATLTIRRRKVEVELVNVSSRGAMVRSGVDAGIGERVEIRFADCNRLRATVRWLKAGQIGLEFEGCTEIIADSRTQERITRPHLALVPAGDSSGDTRKDRAVALRTARQGLVWAGILYWTYEALSVRVRNISPEGAMIDCDRDLPLGAEVRLNLAEAGTLGGVVRWSSGGQIGLKFSEEFDLTLLGRARPLAFVPAVARVHGEADRTRFAAGMVNDLVTVEDAGFGERLGGSRPRLD